MKERYRIGDISCMLDIPEQTLRFYENKGVLRPDREHENGYRVYTAWDLNDIFDTMLFRASGLSLEEVASMLNASTVEEKRISLAGQESKLRSEAARLVRAADALAEKRELMRTFLQDSKSLTPCIGPELICYRFRKHDTMQTPTGSEAPLDLQRELAPWLKAMPTATPTFIIRLEKQADGSANYMSSVTPYKGIVPREYWWALSMTVEEAKQLGIPASPPSEILPARDCVRAVFEAGPRGTFLSSFAAGALKAALDAGYTPTADPYGKIITKTRADGGFQRYFEAWIPVT